MSMDLELGFPRIRGLCGVVCLFVNQGVYWFMWWSIIVTWSLDVKTELARFTSLCPPRIRLPSLPGFASIFVHGTKFMEHGTKMEANSQSVLLTRGVFDTYELLG